MIILYFIIAAFYISPLVYLGALVHPIVMLILAYSGAYAAFELFELYLLRVTGRYVMKDD